MSKTIRFSDGDYFVNENTGKLQYIDGPAKLAQDLIEEFMTEFDPITSHGTKIRQLNNINLVRQEVAETVDRFKARQRANTKISPREQVDEITQLVVKTYDGVNVVFFVQVSTVAKDQAQFTLLMDQSKNLVQVEHQFL